jgi:hypothetical protein
MARANAIDQGASTAGIDSTPTILVGKTGSPPAEVSLSSPTDITSVERAITAAQS